MFESIFERFFGKRDSSSYGGIPGPSFPPRGSDEEMIWKLFEQQPPPQKPPEFFFFHSPPGFPFFSEIPSHHSQDTEDPRRREQPPMAPFGGNPFDIFRHMDEIFRGFDDMFRGMTIIDVPVIEGSPPIFGQGQNQDQESEKSLRDKMLKQPDVDAHGRSLSPRSPSPGYQSQGMLDRLWATDKWDKKTHEKIDRDLDAAAKEGQLERILGPLKSFNPQQGPPQPYPMERPGQQPSSFSRISVRSFRSADGKMEERRSVEDDSGHREDTISRTIDGQTYTTITETSPFGSQSVKEDFKNMSPEEKSAFERRWHAQVGHGPLKIDQKHEDLLHNKMADAQRETSQETWKLFGFNFPGFNFSKKSDPDR